MKIKIIDNEGFINLTIEEFNKFNYDWQQSQLMTTRPTTFEQYVRAHKQKEKKNSIKWADLSGENRMPYWK